MLDDFLKRNPLYYSDTFDLTVSFKMYETQIKKKLFLHLLFFLIQYHILPGIIQLQKYLITKE